MVAGMTRRPVTETSHGYKRASDLLKQEVGAWIDAKRQLGVSWRHIANELYLHTKGKMHANESTLANWHKAWAEQQADGIEYDEDGMTPVEDHAVFAEADPEIDA